MSHSTAHETLTLTTPRGHEVTAELDYENFELYRAQAIHTQTGVIRPLDDEISSNLARALRAKQVYEHALEETKAVEETLSRLGSSVVGLSPYHPALRPYVQEMERHSAIARDMKTHATQFHTEAMKAIDRLMED